MWHILLLFRKTWFYVHNKIHEVEHENVGVEGAHKSELVAEAGVEVVIAISRTACLFVRGFVHQELAGLRQVVVIDVDFQVLAGDARIVDDDIATGTAADYRLVFGEQVLVAVWEIHILKLHRCRRVPSWVLLWN